MPDISHDGIHRLSAEDVLKRMETTNGGLSSGDVQRRLAHYGPNVLVGPSHYSLLRGLLQHFTHFLAILLWIAAGLSFAADIMTPGEGMATLGCGHPRRHRDQRRIRLLPGIQGWASSPGPPPLIA